MNNAPPRDIPQVKPVLTNPSQQDASDADTIQHTPPHAPIDSDDDSHRTNRSTPQSERDLHNTQSDDSHNTEPAFGPPAGTFGSPKNIPRHPPQTLDTVTHIELSSMQHSVRKRKREYINLKNKLDNHDSSRREDKKSQAFTNQNQHISNNSFDKKNCACQMEDIFYRQTHGHGGKLKEYDDK